MTQLGDVIPYLSFEGAINVGDTLTTDKTLLQEYGSISTSITSDQNLSLAVQFSNNGSLWYNSTQTSVIANISQTVTTVIIGRWCRIEILNAGLAPSNVNISTYATTNPLALQTQIQKEGNNYPTFNVGNFSSGVYGDLRTCTDRVLIDHKFIYTTVSGSNFLEGPDPYLTNFNSGGLVPGSEPTISNHMLKLQNIAASPAGEWMYAIGTCPIIYTTGHPLETTFTFKTDITGYVDPDLEGIDNMMVGIGNTGAFGISHNIIDGVFLGYPSAPAGPDSAVNQLALIYYNNSVESYIPISRWQIDRLNGTGPSGVTLDLTKLSVWRIRLAYHGSTSILLEYHLPYDNLWQACHRIILENDISVPNFFNPSFRFIEYVKRTTLSTFDVMLGGTSIFCSAIQIGIEEGSGIRNRLGNFSYATPIAGVATSPSTEPVILAIQNSALLNGTVMGGNLLVNSVSVFCDTASVNTIFNIYTGGSFTGPGWSVPPGSSASASSLQYLNAGTYKNDGLIRYSFCVGGGGASKEDLTNLELYLGPTETLVMTASSFAAGNATASVSVTQIV